MTRELRFRIWHSGGMDYNPMASLVNGILTPEAEGAPIMQSTGVTDRTRQLVYEGDIVEAWSEGYCAKFEVKWRGDGGGAPLWLLYPAYQYGEFWHLNAPHDHGLEVIGNVHEHPDLADKAHGRPARWLNNKVVGWVEGFLIGNINVTALKSNLVSVAGAARTFDPDRFRFITAVSALVAEYESGAIDEPTLQIRLRSQLLTVRATKTV